VRTVHGTKKKEGSMRRVQMSEFGNDHWSLLAYVETLCVDSRGNGIGEIDKRRLSCNPKRHPVHAVNEASGVRWKDDYSTRLAEGAKPVLGHDDWDCLDDLEAEGLIEIMSEANGFVVLSDRGRELASRIRAHKSKGGSFSTFRPSETVSS
jgi:hypothetical protein